MLRNLHILGRGHAQIGFGPTLESQVAYILLSQAFNGLQLFSTPLASSVGV